MAERKIMKIDFTESEMNNMFEKLYEHHKCSKHMKEKYGFAYNDEDVALSALWKLETEILKCKNESI